MNIENNIEGTVEQGRVLRPQTRPIFGPRFDLLMIAGILLAIVQSYLCFGDMSYYLENGLFETCQNIFLLLASVLYFQAARSAPEHVSRSFWLALSIFCMCILFREFDVVGTRFEPTLGPIFHHHLRYGFLVVLWIALLIGSWGHVSKTLLLTPRWLVRDSGRILLVGIALYVLGDIAEKHFLTGNPDFSEMMEETFEQFGTMFIFLSGYATLRKRRS